MHIDRIALVYPSVGSNEVSTFSARLRSLQESLNFVFPKDIRAGNDGVLDEVEVEFEEIRLVNSHYIGKRKKEYHYNWLLGTEAEGRIYIGWKHNSQPNNSREAYDMRVEFNPSKIDEDKLEHRLLLELLREFIYFQGKSGIEEREVIVTMMDLAQDFDRDMSSFSIFAKGRKPDFYKGTMYFGKRGYDGFMRVYDKKKERLKSGEQVREKYLTRFEYKWKAKSRSEGVSLKAIDKIELGIDKRYEIFKRGELKALKAEHEACVLAYQMGLIPLERFTRTTQNHIKKILSEQAERISMEEIFRRDILKEKKRLIEMLIG